MVTLFLCSVELLSHINCDSVSQTKVAAMYYHYHYLGNMLSPLEYVL